MSTKDSVRDLLFGSRRGEKRTYRCQTCQSSFTTRNEPSIAACPGCGAHKVREV